jgi:hypothetical protein
MGRASILVHLHVLALSTPGCPGVDQAPEGGAAGAAVDAGIQSSNSGSGGGGGAANGCAPGQGATGGTSAMAAGDAGSQSGEAGHAGDPGGCLANVCYGDAREPACCALDTDCDASDAPRCLAERRVSAALYSQWTCQQDARSTGETVNYSFRVVELVTQRPVAALTVKACRDADTDCAAPVATFEDSAGNGDVTLKLPTGFRGFFSIQSTALPERFYVTRPLIADATHRDISVFAASTISELANLLGAHTDVAKGTVFLESSDCTNKAASGVHFTSTDNAAAPFYIIDALPTSDASVTQLDTSQHATAGFLNVEPGQHDFTAALGVDGIALATVSAAISDNAVTWIDIAR